MIDILLSKFFKSGHVSRQKRIFVLAEPFIISVSMFLKSRPDDDYGIDVHEHIGPQNFFHVSVMSVGSNFDVVCGKQHYQIILSTRGVAMTSKSHAPPIWRLLVVTQFDIWYAIRLLAVRNKWSITWQPMTVQDAPTPIRTNYFK